MGSRIKELIKQATVLTDNPDERVQRLELNKVLLAELIVQECINVLDEDDGATHHAELLKEHFGVK